MNIDDRKCKFVKKGKQCQAYPVRGTDFCYAHTKHKQDYPTGFYRPEGRIIAAMKSGEHISLEYYADGHFFSVPDRIVDPDIVAYIGASGIAVFVALCCHVKRFNGDGTRAVPMSFPKIETISKECGCDARQVRRIIDKLVACKMLLVVRMWTHSLDGRKTANPDDLVGKGWEPTSNRYYIRSQQDWCVPV